MKVRSQFPRFAPLRQRGLGITEFEDILDIFPRASLLIDLSNRKVLLANSKATELSAYTRQELTSSNLDLLFSLEIGELTGGVLLDPSSNLEGFLIQRNGRKAPVRLEIHPIGHKRNRAVLSFNSRSGKGGTDLNTGKKLQDQRWEALNLLMHASHQKMSKESIRQILQAGQLLIGASLLTVYQIRNSGSELNQIAIQGNQETLPSIILTAEDSKVMQIPAVWIPGESATHSLHQAAIANKLNYLAMVPLDQNGSFEGILVAADQASDPPDDIIDRMNLLAGLILAAFEQSETPSSTVQIIDEEVSNYQNILNNIQDGVIFTNPDLVITQMNSSGEGILGYSNAEVNNQSIEALLVSTPSILPALKAAQQGFPSYNLTNIKLHHRKGQPFPSNLRVIPIITNGEVEKIAILISDLSDQEDFRVRTQQLEHQAFLGEISAIFAHEVRNPINNISTGLQVMAMNLPSDDAAQDQINRIQGDFERLTDLMKSVLTFSGRREYRIEAIDLPAMLDKILDKWRPRESYNNINFSLHNPSISPTILGDRRSLEQVFVNLITNAINAISDNEGDITIKINVPTEIGLHSYAEILISDNGPGVFEETMDHIFEPFYTTKKEGTGLGLVISKRIIEAHKGKISAESFPGGSIFTIKLPIARPGTLPDKRRTA